MNARATRSEGQVDPERAKSGGGSGSVLSTAAIAGISLTTVLRLRGMPSMSGPATSSVR
jgi:hypothetical protein